MPYFKIFVDIRQEKQAKKSGSRNPASGKRNLDIISLRTINEVKMLLFLFS